MNNIVSVKLDSRYASTLGVWQYDYGQVLRITGPELPPAVEVQFSLAEKSGETLSRVGTTVDGVTEVKIPDELLTHSATSDYRIYAYIYLTDETSGNTKYEITIPVRVRSKPTSPAEDPETDPDLFRETIVAVNASAERAKMAEQNAKESATEAGKYAASASESAVTAEKTKEDALRKVGEKKREAIEAIQNQEETSVGKITTHTDGEIQRIQNQATDSKAGIEQTITNAGVSKEGLDESIQTASDTKTALDKSVELAGTAKTELDTSIREAGTAKIALDESTETAGTVQETLSATVKQAGALDTSLGEKIETGTQLKTDLVASGEKAVQDIQTAGSEQLGKMQAVAEAFTADREQVATNKEDIGSLKEDLSNKITKFYASNQGKTHLADSDNGKIQDMMLYGKSSQDGTPTPENPVEIKSVVNPIVKVYGKNMMPYPKDNTARVNGVTLTAKDGKYTLVGKPTKNTWMNIYPQIINSTANTMLSEKPLPTKGKKLSMINGGMGYSLNFRKVSDKDKVFGIEHDNASLADEDSNGVFLHIYKTDKNYNDTFEIMISDPADTTSTVFEPYTEQEVSLPYTLNAIPVSSGGNVTINGQQYIADYVDVEHRKVIRNILKWHLVDIKSVFNNNSVWHMNISGLGIDGSKIGLSNMFKIQKDHYGGVTTSELHIDISGKFAALNMRGMTDEEFKKWLIEKNPEVYNVLTVAEEIPITLEEVLAFKQLMTYYPVTNISVNSEQLDGYAVFNYPISMANGWNYVKKQLNDNRDYIYDMDLQSAEAYVNSEYAVALTELEV